MPAAKKAHHHLHDLPFALGLLAVALAFPLLIMNAKADTAPIIISGPTVNEADITDTEASISWQTDVESSTYVYYGTAEPLTQFQRNIEFNPGAIDADAMSFSHHIILRELDKGTTYLYRVRSTSAGGAMVESAVKTFKTLGSAFTGTPLGGVSLTAPAAGAALQPPVQLKAAIEGAASSVQFVVSGPTSLQLAGTQNADGWSVTAADLKPGAYTVAAIASGFGPDGAAITKTGPEVAFEVPAPAAEEPVVKKEPAPKVEMQGEQPTAKVAEEASPPTDTTESAPQALQEGTPAPEGQPTEPTAGQGTPELNPAAAGEVLLLEHALNQLESENVASSIQPSGVPQDLNQPAPAVSGSDLCTQNGILGERCSEWLKVKFGNTSCAEEGITTREACEKSLEDKNNGVFPGCEGKSQEACDSLKKLATLDYLPETVKKQADDAIATLITGDKVVELPGLMPVPKKDLSDVSWWPSAPSANAGTSPGLLIIDSNINVMAKNVEGIALSPTEKALVLKRPLEQPRGAGKTDSGFKVALAPAEPKPAEKAGGSARFSGQCAPKSTCLIYIYSYVPMVLAVAADDNGQFTYTLDKSLLDGQHTVYVAVTDDTGKITSKSDPLSLFVKAAHAVTQTDYLKADVNVTTVPASNVARSYVVGAILLTLLAALAVWQVTVRSSQKKA